MHSNMQRKIAIISRLCQNITYFDPLKKYTYWSFHCTAESILSGRPLQCREIGLGRVAVMLSLHGLHSQNVRFFNKYFGICINSDLEYTYDIHILSPKKLIDAIFIFFAIDRDWDLNLWISLGTPYFYKSMPF